jgi:hypothetical protein
MITSEFAKALVAVAKEMRHPKFDRVNNAFRQGGEPSKYASLGSLLDTVRPIYAKHGIAVLQGFNASDGMLEVETTLVHESGELMADLAKVPLPPNPQHAMAMATYVRRAQLSAMAGVVGDDDDDGNTAAEPVAKREIPDAELAERVEAVRRRQGVESAITGQKKRVTVSEVLSDPELLKPSGRKPSGDLVTIVGTVAKVYENALPKGGFVYKIQLEDGPKLTGWGDLPGVAMIVEGKTYEFRCALKDGKYGPEHTIKDFAEAAAPHGTGEDIPF